MPDRTLRQALEAELAANPDDLATHAAYADLLTEQGDDRGEFIMVQMALEDPTRGPAERKRLARREEELLESSAERWLGRLGRVLSDECGFAFRRGWLDRLGVRRLSLELARRLRDAPQARLLRDLSIERVLSEEEEMSDEGEEAEIHPDDNVPAFDPCPAVWPLVGAATLANVRRFTLGEDAEDDYRAFHCRVDTPAVPHLVRGMPRLEELHLFASGYDPGELLALPTLKNLRLLQLYHNYRVCRLDVLAANPAARRLTHLLCHPHAVAWGTAASLDQEQGFVADEGYLPLSVVRALLASPHLSCLTHLRLRCSSMGDEGVRDIVRSGILSRLQVLDLRHGRVTDEGARVIAGCPDARGLKMLDLGHNTLTAAGVELLRGLGVPVALEGQTDNENAFLYEGDQTEDEDALPTDDDME
jgi:uncharacterized protein (TIGR02996 family)